MTWKLSSLITFFIVSDSSAPYPSYFYALPFHNFICCTYVGCSCLGSFLLFFLSVLSFFLLVTKRKTKSPRYPQKVDACCTFSFFYFPVSFFLPPNSFLPFSLFSSFYRKKAASALKRRPAESEKQFLEISELTQPPFWTSLWVTRFRLRYTTRAWFHRKTKEMSWYL